MQGRSKRSARRHPNIQHGAMEYVDPPTDLDAVRLYRLGRIREQLERRDYAGVLLFDPIATRYATDCTNMQLWCTHYETRCVLVMTDGPVVLFDYARHPFLAEGLPTIDEYRVMDSFYYFNAGPRSGEWAGRFGDQIADLVRRHAGRNRRLAVDRLSHLGIDALRSRGLEIFDGQEVTEIARSIKSEGEVILMKAAIEVCESGMAAMQQAMRPGISENELWSLLHQTNIARGGEWIETRLLCSGPRTNPWYQESSMRVIEAGDMISFDTDLIGPYGYCADISRAWVCGAEPSDEQRRLYAHAYEQLQHDLGLIEPGMSFEQLSAAAWPIPTEFRANRYGCMIHGVGLADEWPNIVYPEDWNASGYDGLIEPNMVLSIESYIGAENGREGVKLEEMVLVTEQSVERLSRYPFEERLLR
jgi:Xaa-Pro aminopeptidase